MQNTIRNFLVLGLIMACVPAIATAPLVVKIVWGTITVTQETKDGATKSKYKDCKLFPTGSSVWNWKETGTEHVPGIQLADLEEFIDDVDVVILSRGMHNVLRTRPETEDYLKAIKKEYHILTTPEAVELYNKLAAEGKKVGALIHSTC